VSPEDAAALEAAQAASREQADYVVTERGLVHNGRTLRRGARVTLHAADAEILIARGRVKPAKGKGKPESDGDGQLPAGE
jgi:hypothetical protein